MRVLLAISLFFTLASIRSIEGVKNGKFSIDMMIAQTNAVVEENAAAKIISMINACGHLTDQEDLCKAAYDYAKCSWEYDSSSCFFP